MAARATGGRPTRSGLARRTRGGIVAFLLASVVPLGVTVYVLALPAADREALLAKIPSGVAGRALAAGAAFGAMALLAWVALPAFHNASGLLRGVASRLRGRPPVVRLLLFPFELGVAVAWFLLQVLFAVDVFLILATALLGLLLAIRIVDPTFLPHVLPGLGG